MKILIVDDDLGLANMLALTFEERGFQTVICYCAVNALEELKRQQFALIVSDYRMPGMDGIEFRQRIIDSNVSEAPFVFFTGNTLEVRAKIAPTMYSALISKGEDIPWEQFERLLI